MDPEHNPFELISDENSLLDEFINRPRMPMSPERFDDFILPQPSPLKYTPLIESPKYKDTRQ